MVASGIFAFGQSAEGVPLQAVIHDGDGQTHVLDLESNSSLVVNTSLGKNTVVIEDGAARIVEADCAHGDCLRQQAISKPGQQLICLPHKLWVEVVPRDGVGSTMDVSAVETDGGNDASVDAVAR